VQAADFSVLLRPEATYSRAGFPTKFVESVASSTPVIANLTSDLARYVVDGRAGLVVEAATAEALANTISRAADMSPARRDAMRKTAREVAVQSFDFRSHVAAIDNFLSRTRA
jgi:glycosyltransferase involved in cell wall biosynthesis